MIQEILPAVANINNKISPPPPNIDSTVEVNGGTTSHHYAVVESDHPYKPATVSNYKVITVEPPWYKDHLSLASATFFNNFWKATA